MWYLKKINKTYIVFGFFLLLLTLVPLSKGVPNTHDAENHLARLAAYNTAFSDYHIPPRWAGHLNYGYGIPVFNFFYPLPGYIGTALQFVGLTIQSSFMLMFVFTILMSCIGFFFLAKIYTDSNTAFLGAILYSLAPYQLLNVFVRGDIGESLALSIVPLVFYFIFSAINNKNIRSTIVAAGMLGLLVLAHNGVSLMFMPLILLYAIVNSYISKNISTPLLVFVLGFGLSAFFWIPALFEHRYTLASFFIGDFYNQHFLDINRIIYSPWGFGANTNQTGGLSPQIGIVLSTVTLFGLFTKKAKKISLLFGMVGVLSLLMSLSKSQIVWETLPLLHKYQFPWRFLGLATFCLCMFTVIRIRHLSFPLGLLFLLTVGLQTQSMISVKEYINKSDLYFKSFSGTTFYHGEATTIWSTGQASEFPKLPYETIDGIAEIVDYKKHNSSQTFKINAKSDSTIKLNTLYYPGWKVFLDETEIPIQFQDQNHRGLITFAIPAGTYSITAIFTETKSRAIANLISVVCAIVSVGIILLRKYE